MEENLGMVLLVVLKKKIKKKREMTSYTNCKCLVFGSYQESWLEIRVFVYPNTMLK